MMMLKTILRTSYRVGIPFVLNRGEFPFILNAMGLKGEGAEIGVKHGQFSEYLLEQWKGKTLYSIDAWREFSQETYRDGANVSQVEQDRIYSNTMLRLSKFGPRAKIIRGLSTEVANQFQDAQLDFAYIDAAHDYENVTADLNAWLPKIKKGGILAGHDYMDSTWKSTDFGVKSAVDEFVAKHKFAIKLSLREPHHKSYFIFV